MGEPKKKYYMFQEGNDILFVINIPPSQVDEAVIRIFKQEVAARGLDNVIYPNVEEIIRNAEKGKPIKIGGFVSSEEPKAPAEETQASEQPEASAEAKQAKKPETPAVAVEEKKSEAEVRVVVDPNGMKAYLDAVEKEGTLTREAVRRVLEQAGIKYGIIEENIGKAVEEWPFSRKILIAEGSQPRTGEPGKVELVKNVKDNLAPTVTRDGYVDFKRLDLISAIEAGEVLQIRTPPTPGISGSDVFGKVIPASPGKDVRLSKGQNTEISEDGTKLLSTKAGFLHLTPDGKINVRPVYQIEGDVDYSTGNVEYRGDILVKGDVRAGFEVKAGGDVHVYGAVEDAIIEAGGNITINGGILSSGKARIKAGGDVSIGFIQYGSIEAGGSVYIRIEAIGSTIMAGRDVEVLKRNGRIAGGTLVVGGWVVSQVIGSEKAPHLHVKFQTDPDSAEDLENGYKFCFVSTRSLATSMVVQFGMVTTNVHPTSGPITILLRDKKILVEERFVTPEELKALARDRDPGGHST